MSNDTCSPITVIGSINVDFSVTADRLPQPGESVIGNEFLRAFGGKGANQAVGISRLTDRPVQFIGAVGNDELGADGIESLNQNRIDTRFVRVVEGVNTGVALIMIDQQGENCIVAAPGANAYVDTEYLNRLPVDVFRDSKMFVLCQEIPVESLEIIVKRAGEYKTPVLFNPAPPNPRLAETQVLQNVDFVTPNETEAAAILEVDVLSLTEKKGQLNAVEKLSNGGATSVAITLGKSGCLVFDRETMGSPSEAVQVSAPKVQAIDTTAAGDSFNAALAVALSEGKNLVDACCWANLCASVSVTRRGAQPSLPTREDLQTQAR